MLHVESTRYDIYCRDMKLDNLLITGNSVKISDFGTAMRLDQNMKLPFTFGMHNHQLLDTVYTCMIVYIYLYSHTKRWQ